jgi:hypothetical protein
MRSNLSFRIAHHCKTNVCRNIPTTFILGNRRIIALLVLDVNKILKWCSITSGGKKYTRPIKEVNGELFFLFKKSWHRVNDFLSDHAEELVQEGAKIFSRAIKK